MLFTGMSVNIYVHYTAMYKGKNSQLNKYSFVIEETQEV